MPTKKTTRSQPLPRHVKAAAKPTSNARNKYIRPRELSEMNRRHSLLQTLAILEHQVNQPLAAAANFARASVGAIQNNQGVSQEQLLDWMEKSAQQVERVSKLMADMEKLVYNDHPGERTSVGLNQLVANAVVDSRLERIGQVENQLEVRYVLDKSDPTVWANTIEIELVVAHLLRNACEALTDVPPAKRRLTIRTAKQRSDVFVTVSDNGCGVPAEQRSKLFTPLYSSKAGRFALGLTICRSIVQSHGGTIKADFRSPRETAITFSLPQRKVSDFS